MKQWQKIIVTPDQTLLETMKIIDNSSLQFAVVVDEERHLLGTVTDGDVRRGILRGEGLEVPITSIMNANPISVQTGQRPYRLKQFMKSKKLKQLPIVNKHNQVVDIFLRIT